MALHGGSNWSSGEKGVLSRKFKTIFVHIPKTGGQSVEMVFIREHALTWKTRAPLLLRFNADPRKGPKRLAHLLARQYTELDHVSAETFAEFFKFAVVRNPYDRFVSYINYREPQNSDRPEAVFEHMARDAFTRHFLAPQIDYIADSTGKIIVDTIVRFERLQEELNPVFQRVLGKTVTLEHVNKSPEKRITRDSLSQALRQKIYKYYEADFDRFSYPSGITA
jgi:hypothetical protein